MTSEYLNAVSKTIGSSTKRAEITEELMSHLCDKRDYHFEHGYDEKEAIRRADEDMGDPDDCAVPLNALHPAGSRTWLISVICILLILLPISHQAEAPTISVHIHLKFQVLQASSLSLMSGPNSKVHSKYPLQGISKSLY